MNSNIYQIKYNKLETTKEENARLNPPYSKNVKTSVGKVFLKLVKKVPLSHNLCKIFKKNTVKISYSCMKSINFGFLSHDKGILNPRITSFG